MAAEVVAQAGIAVDLYDAMPSVGRKFLLAGIGGLNITHSELFAPFVDRYGGRVEEMRGLLADFDAVALREWVHGLGIDTFVGSSGRVFPTGMKAAPLLRAWLHRLREAGVVFHRRHRFTGWSADGELCFDTPEGEARHAADGVILALGGASWPRLGSDGRWVPWLRQRGIAVADLQPANCGFDAGWSDYLRSHFAGVPLKSVVASCVDQNGRIHRRPGEMVITATGVEGSLVYALSAFLRDALAARGDAVLTLDLLPDRALSELQLALAKPKGKESFSNWLRKRTGIDGVKLALLREVAGAETLADPSRLATAIKHLPLHLHATRPLAEAISSAGGVCFEALTPDLMLKPLPGVFCAGEMLDWEAPTGGYLLTACFASGRRAGQGALRWRAAQSAVPLV
jgi:uncharacterized flavoprotein (TIGR03862 family)